MSTYIIINKLYSQRLSRKTKHREFVSLPHSMQYIINILQAFITVKFTIPDHRYEYLKYLEKIINHMSFSYLISC